MELLDRLLGVLDVEVEAFAICEVSQGWRLTFGPGDAPTVHYGLKGSGVMALADGRRLGVAPDTLLLLPRGIGLSFELSEGTTRERRVGPQLLSRVKDSLSIRAGGDEVSFAVACGRVRASYAGLVDLVAYLSGPLVESFGQPSPVRGAFETVLAELAAPTIGTRALTSALLKQCLVLLLRQRSARDDRMAAWLPALGDARLAKPVLAMLERPASSYTLGELASLAGMSRSAFAEHFSAGLGRAPMDFLKEVRLRHAARLLQTTDLPIKAVATNVGYTSRSYFARAFKTLHGVYPASFRDQVAGAGIGAEVASDGGD